MMNKFALFLATTCYSGYCPVAPGTVGAFIAVVALWFLPALSTPVLGSVFIASYFVGVWASGIAEKAWGVDPGRVNWDEVAGMMITLLFLPKHWIIYAAGFLAFRFFDVLKPWPVNVMEKLPGGWGIMSDDVMAGIYSNIVLQILFRLLIKLPA
ncbi:MAG TPA: phosphatidylglycerophosphatase A [bacterium]|nr:phosphatidylglycerophosphatase A [bacterium]HPN42919.1 phosphatidylglycerophosphatase A [bacterium]